MAGINVIARIREIVTPIAVNTAKLWSGAIGLEISEMNPITVVMPARRTALITSFKPLKTALRYFSLSSSPSVMSRAT